MLIYKKKWVFQDEVILCITPWDLQSPNMTHKRILKLPSLWQHIKWSPNSTDKTYRSKCLTLKSRYRHSIEKSVHAEWHYGKDKTHTYTFKKKKKKKKKKKYFRWELRTGLFLIKIYSQIFKLITHVDSTKLKHLPASLKRCTGPKNITKCYQRRVCFR